MKRISLKKLASTLTVSLAAVACADDDTSGTATPPAPAATNDAGSSSSSSASSSGSSSGSNDGGDTNPGTCEAAKATALGPIDTISKGEVKTLEDKDGAKTIYVDATAVSQPEAKKNPRIYMNLGTAKRVDVTDVGAATSADWDLALKRPVLFTNGGQAGKGQGGAKFLKDKDFADVTKADATDLKTEEFFDAECNPKTDMMGAIETSFTGWYDYNQSNNTLKPFAGTWVVKGGTGKLYKLAILTYYADPDGKEGEVSARYTMKVAPLD